MVSAVAIEAREKLPNRLVFIEENHARSITRRHDPYRCDKEGIASCSALLNAGIEVIENSRACRVPDASSELISSSTQSSHAQLHKIGTYRS